MDYDEFTDTGDDGPTPDTPKPAETTTAKGDYEVGYGKPPKHSQFQKGKSGNEGGRPKADKPETDETVYEREMNRKVWVVIDGKRKRIPQRELIIRRAVGLAMQADPKALALILKMEEKFGALREPPPKVEGAGLFIPQPPLTMEQWYRVWGGPQETPTIPLLEEMREQLFKEYDEEQKY